MVKCFLSVTGLDAKEDFNIKKLCGGMEAVIEGGIHAMWML